MSLPQGTEEEHQKLMSLAPGLQTRWASQLPGENKNL